MTKGYNCDVEYVQCYEGHELNDINTAIEQDPEQEDTPDEQKRDVAQHHALGVHAAAASVDDGTDDEGGDEERPADRGADR